MTDIRQLADTEQADIEQVAESTLRALCPVVLHGVPSIRYHTSAGLSHSGTKELRRTPYHFKRKSEPTAPAAAPSDAMLNGTLVHCSLLEPAEWPRRYVVPPESANDKRTKAYKEFAAEAAQLGLTPITQLQADAATAQADALRMVPTVARLLGTPGAGAEVSAWWIDGPSGVLCKCRPDFVAPVGYGRGAVLVDVKTTSDAAPDAFARSVQTFSYHTQAAWYCEGYALASGLQVHGMLFAVVESAYPYAATAYMLSDAALALARRLNLEARALYARCAAANDWPGYPMDSTGINVIDLPYWAYREAA